MDFSCKKPSTKNSYSSTNAYNVNLDNGNMNNDNKDNDNNNRARCVREHEFTFSQVYQAYLACRKRKRNTINALRFEADLECNLEKLVYELNNKTYRPARSVCFTILKPKPREIFAADFKDRIVHHLLFNHLNPIYEKKFIYDSFACRKNKGTLASVKRVQKYLRSITQNNTKRAYYLQLDIHNFFMSIDKNILFCLIEKHLKDKTYFWLAEILIYNDPTNNYIQKSNKKIRANVPKHKSLLNVEKDKGLPIGNLTSQFFANVYLNELDQFVKHKLKCKYYVRYVDDFILLHNSKEQLKKYQKEIKEFLKNKLKLELKQLVKLQPVSNGINFIGYIIKNPYLLPRNRNINNLIQTIKKHEKECIEINKNKSILNYEKIPKLCQSLNSFFGHIKYSKCKKLMQEIYQKYFFLNIFFIIFDYKVMDRYCCKKTNFKNQYDFFRNQSKKLIILMQVGNYFRSIGRDASLIYLIFDYNLENTKNYCFVNIPKKEISFVIEELIKLNYIVLKIRQINYQKPIMRELENIYLPKRYKNKIIKICFF